MGNELIPQEIRTIYDNYLSDTIHLEETRKPTDGLFGFGKRADSDPCHDRFSDRLEQALKNLSITDPSSETAYEVLRFVYGAPQEYKENKLAYWMLQAVHGQTDELIRFLSNEDAAKLSVWYNNAYPKRVLLPVQKTVAEHLQAQAGLGTAKKRSGLTNFFRGASK